VIVAVAGPSGRIETTLRQLAGPPVGYRRLDAVETTYAARTHAVGRRAHRPVRDLYLLDLTFGRVNPSFVPGDVYHNVVASLRVWPVAAAYIAAMVVLACTCTGTWSALQTLGTTGRRPVGGVRGAGGRASRY